MLKLVIFCAAFIFSSVVFYFFPSIDLKVSAMFFNADLGGFYLTKNPVVKLLHDFVPILSVLTALTVGFIALNKFKKNKSWDLNNYKREIYFILVCALGAGLIIHNVVKDTFNRPRPNMIMEFGGAKNFETAFVISEDCNGCQSFVSGHSAAGFMFFAVAFLFKSRKKHNYGVLLGLGLGSIFGAVRIMEGGHFLSDVVFAGFLMYMVAYALAKIIKPAE